MKLLTAALREKLPPLYANEDKKPEDIPVICKFFNPSGAGTWYATEFDGEDTFFGYCHIHEGELGYFSLRELEEYRTSFGLRIERDLYYRGETLANVMLRVE